MSEARRGGSRGLGAIAAVIVAGAVYPFLFPRALNFGFSLVLFAALKDPFLRRAAEARPAIALDGFRKAAAVELLRERREVLERLRQMGAHVLDAEPDGLTPPVVNRYLEITSRGLL